MTAGWRLLRAAIAGLAALACVAFAPTTTMAQGAALSGAAACEGASAPAPLPLALAEVSIKRELGGAVRFLAEVADSEEARNRGLMFRRALKPMAGMLFVYPTPRRTAFWMRNTCIPLDMIFVGLERQIIHVHENAVPLDETIIDSRGEVIWVFEIAGGEARRLGIRIGDFVSARALQ